MQTAKDYEDYWDRYEESSKGSITYFGGHSTRTDSLNHMPPLENMSTDFGTMAITSDGQAYMWDRILKEWIPQ